MQLWWPTKSQLGCLWIEIKKNIFNEMQPSLPFNGHLQNLILPSYPPQVLILLFSHSLAMCISVPPQDSEIIKGRNYVSLFPPLSVSEHSILDVVCALAILIECLCFLVARSSLFLLSQTRVNTKTFPWFFVPWGYGLKICVWNEAKWIPPARSLTDS